MTYMNIGPTDEPMTARVPIVRVGKTAQPAQAAQPEPPPEVPKEVPLVNHPRPQRQLGPSKQYTTGDTTYVETAAGYHAEVDAHEQPPGSNMLDTQYREVYDGFGREIPNTLPSSPLQPYHLHAAEPAVTAINPKSPTDDLAHIFDRLVNLLTGRSSRDFWAGHGGDPADEDELGRVFSAAEADMDAVRMQLSRAVHILEGNPIPNRAYSGFPVLHYQGPHKIKQVEAIRDGTGTIIGGNVNVHQIWYDTHIESDTAFVDVSPLIAPDGSGVDVSYTITYTVDVLTGAKDDFAPFGVYHDDPHYPPGKTPGEAPEPGVGFDQTCYPLTEGTRAVFTVKQPPAKYSRFIHTHGWRAPGLRGQTMENARNVFPATSQPGGWPQRQLPEYEADVFGRGKSPREAIEMISDLAPEKRMWRCFMEALAAIENGADCRGTLGSIVAARRAFHDWQHRSRLPSGVQLDPNADITLLYVNNTIYAQHTDGSAARLDSWRTRGTTAKITIINADYYPRGYDNLDLGGARGWENQFKPTVKDGGIGVAHTFGRVWHRSNLDTTQPIILPAATRDASGNTQPSYHKVHITFGFEPHARVRFYQYDPMHHDVGVHSVH